MARTSGAGIIDSVGILDKINRVKNLLLRSGTLLGAASLVSKCLGLLRDRLFLRIFGQGETLDTIFASFRIPDFFYFLLIAGAVGVLFVPRYSHLKSREEQMDFLWSFVWLFILGFGALCLVGILGSSHLFAFMAQGLPAHTYAQGAQLTAILFGSVFLLSLSAVFSAFLQAEERFVALALSPILYTGGICAGVYFGHPYFGILGVGYAAVGGALLHLSVTLFSVWRTHPGFRIRWYAPQKAWKGFAHDFVFRVGNNSAFQINQSADIWIASFLIPGTIGAFNIGTNLGSALLSIVGFSLAKVAFPRFSKSQHCLLTQKKILLQALLWAFVFSVPFTLVGVLGSESIVHVLYDMEGVALQMAARVFWWTVLSLPFACSLPVMMRFFYARNDVRTPLIISAIALFTATFTAGILALRVLPPEHAILGLALGNFIANTLSFVLYGVGIFLCFRKHAAA